MPEIMIHLVDLAIAILVVEALALVWLRARHRLSPRDIALIALAGLGLLLALRAALSGAGPVFVIAGLTLGGLAHAADLAARLRRAAARDR
jgi:hypothetical protein